MGAGGLSWVAAAALNPTGGSLLLPPAPSCSRLPCLASKTGDKRFADNSSQLWNNFAVVPDIYIGTVDQQCANQLLLEAGRKAAALALNLMS